MVRRLSGSGTDARSPDAPMVISPGARLSLEAIDEVVTLLRSPAGERRAVAWDGRDRTFCEELAAAGVLVPTPAQGPAALLAVLGEVEYARLETQRPRMKPENRQHVGPRDVVLAAHPGSGTSWIGTLLVRLGVFYVSGEDELLTDRVSQASRRVTENENRPLPGAAAGGRPHVGFQAQLDHLPALRDRDKEQATWREPLRVIKTNGSATEWTPPGRVLFLVRDGRDAVLSLYHSHVNFSGLEVPLLDFLTGNGGAWAPPPMSWGFACMSWLGTPRESLHILKFETCKERPLEEFRSMLDFLGISRTDDEIRAAIAACSYDAMRREERKAMEEHGERIGGGHIMRRGTVAQWREVYTDEMLRTFAGLPRRTLATLGYAVDTVPHPPTAGRGDGRQ